VQKRNLQNDKKKQSHLIKSGWEVIRFWVSDIEKDVECIVKQVESKIHTMRLSR
jgi:very-short-patch-repair endonuclease